MMEEEVVLNRVKDDNLLDGGDAALGRGSVLLEVPELLLALLRLLFPNPSILPLLPSFPCAVEEVDVHRFMGITCCREL